MRYHLSYVSPTHPHSWVESYYIRKQTVPLWQKRNISSNHRSRYTNTCAWLSSNMRIKALIWNEKEPCRYWQRFTITRNEVFRIFTIQMEYWWLPPVFMFFVRHISCIYTPCIRIYIHSREYGLCCRHGIKKPPVNRSICYILYILCIFYICIYM